MSLELASIHSFLMIFVLKRILVLKKNVTNRPDMQYVLPLVYMSVNRSSLFSQTNNCSQLGFFAVSFFFVPFIDHQACVLLY